VLSTCYPRSEVAPRGGALYDCKGTACCALLCGVWGARRAGRLFLAGEVLAEVAIKGREGFGQLFDLGVGGVRCVNLHHHE
jgi:hypothetical protein